MQRVACFDSAARAATLSTNGFCQPLALISVRPERTLSLSKGKSKGGAQGASSAHRRNVSGRTSLSTSMITSAGIFSRHAASRIASALGASYKQ
jgi:hypothetical protein